MLHWSTFLKLNVPEYTIKSYNKSLPGFAGQRVHARGYVDQLIVCYILVEVDTSYNVLIGRWTLNQLGAVVSIPHMAMKFPALNGPTITVKADPKEARQCYMQSLRINLYSLKTIREQMT